MKTRLLSIAFAALVVAAYFCLILHTRGQAFTPRRPFILQSVTASNQTPEQLASYGLALRWVASDLGTNSLNVNTWTDRIQGAIWKMDEATKRPAYTTNDGVSFNRTHYLTNNTFGPYFQTCCNCCAFGFITDIIDFGNGNLNPPLICNSLPGIPSGAGAGGISEMWGFNNATLKYPLTWWQDGGSDIIVTNTYPITNLWHDLIVGTFWTNTTTTIWFYQITNGVQWSTNKIGAGADSSFGWGMPGDTGLGYSNFPTSLAYYWYRDSGASFYLKELWIWTNNYFPVNRLMPSIVTNFHIYATNTYGYTP